MSRDNAFIDPDLYEYILSTTLRDDPVLSDLREETAGMSEGRMQISADQGQFMGMLVKLSGASRAIEVGVFTGYSSLCVARALPEDGLLVACDISVEYTDVARRYWDRAGVAAKIDLRIGPAMETLDRMIGKGETGNFDFAFIDADKLNYPRYYDLCLQLLRSGGLLLVDNALWGGHVADPERTDDITATLRELNGRAARDPRVEVSLLPIGDGVLIARKV
ncbi:MAG: class I SAM-dependent methyltransferase [bacterium]|nr:class I SAM-dependent methyltransferase [bacterium]MDE0290403.1 class I SAM-dependent methyltransferase [bacterium]MDE0437833.1 class I SAM-dependent methyltransferase [bacterium]